MLPFLGDYPHAKTKILIGSLQKDIDDQRIMQPDLTRRAFWPLTCEPEFSHVIDSCKKLQHRQDFHFTTISAISNDIILQKSFKIQFWSYILPFWSFLHKGDFFQKKTDIPTKL